MEFISPNPDIERALSHERLNTLYRTADTYRLARTLNSHSRLIGALSALGSILIQAGERIKTACAHMQARSGERYGLVK